MWLPNPYTPWFGPQQPVQDFIHQPFSMNCSPKMQTLRPSIGATPQPIGLGDHVPQTMGPGVSQVQNGDVDNFAEVHGQLVQDYIDLRSEEDLEVVARFLKLQGSPLMVGKHALTCIMQYCSIKAVNRDNKAVMQTALQYQLLNYIIEMHQAIGDTVEVAIDAVTSKLQEEDGREEFFGNAKTLAKKVMAQAVECRKEAAFSTGAVSQSAITATQKLTAPRNNKTKAARKGKL